jgi:TRAP-type mannitol/chloroaromatic compound transport system permease small subunit
MRILLTVSNRIDAVLHAVAMFFAWSFILCIAAICFDVISRKFGFQIPGFGSSRLQELEWHLHAILFCTWLGYAYVRDAHVRIDVATASLSERRKAWLELIGCLVFALPYLAVALPYAHQFFMVSFLQNESSDAPNGLAYRWIIKGFLYLSFWGVLFAVVSVALRRIAFLFGDPATAANALAPRRSGEV